MGSGQGTQHRPVHFKLLRVCFILLRLSTCSLLVRCLYVVNYLVCSQGADSFSYRLPIYLSIYKDIHECRISISNVSYLTWSRRYVCLGCLYSVITYRLEIINTYMVAGSGTVGLALVAGTPAFLRKAGQAGERGGEASPVQSTLSRKRATDFLDFFDKGSRGGPF